MVRIPRNRRRPQPKVPLSLERYTALIKDYRKRARVEWFPVRDLPAAARVKLGVSEARISFPVIREIASDFGRTKGLRVFGFGVGYGQDLFFLKNFMGARVQGVDLLKEPEKFTKAHKLGVIHGKSGGDASLRKLGKFDATFSVLCFQEDIMNKKTALGMLDNASVMTRKGGKSYHIIASTSAPVVSPEEVEARGFHIDTWKLTPEGHLFIKLTKTK